MDNDGLDELDYEEVMTNRTTALTNSNIIYSINQQKESKQESQQKESKQQQESKQESKQKKTKQKCNKLNDKKCKFYILSEFI